MLPTSRSSIGYYFQGQYYVVHPDATFWLAYRGRWGPYFIEVERRAITPKRVRERLRNYTAATSPPTGPSGTTAARRPWCSSCSRPPKSRRPSWTPPDITACPCSPPAWNCSRSVACWVKCGVHRRRIPTKGCHCTAWTSCNFVHKSVPRTSGRGPADKRDCTVTNLVRPKKTGRVAFCCKPVPGAARAGRPTD